MVSSSALPLRTKNAEKKSGKAKNSRWVRASISFPPDLYALPPEVPCGNAAQFAIQRRSEFVQYALIPGAEPFQKLGYGPVHDLLYNTPQ
jgi:hypothetical protein